VCTREPRHHGRQLRFDGGLRAVPPVRGNSRDIAWTIATEFLAALINAFEATSSGGWSRRQVSDENSALALERDTELRLPFMMKHAPNLISPMADFPTTDGDKPWRTRDDEFGDTSASRRTSCRLGRCWPFFLHDSQILVPRL